MNHVKDTHEDERCKNHDSIDSTNSLDDKRDDANVGLCTRVEGEQHHVDEVR